MGRGEFHPNRGPVSPASINRCFQRVCPDIRRRPIGSSQHCSHAAAAAAIRRYPWTELANMAWLGLRRDQMQVNVLRLESALTTDQGRAGGRRRGDRQSWPRLAISPLVKCECLVGPIKRGDPVLERAYRALFDQFAPLPMPKTVYLQAAQIHARFGIRTPDALHLACAQHHGCAALWTNDDRLANASHGLALNILR